MDRQLGLLPQSAAKPSPPTFATSPTFYADKSKYFPQLVSPTVGEERKLFESTGHKGGASAAERHAATYEKISRELENQIRLAASVGDEHDKVALAIEIQNKQLEIGKEATAAQRDHVAELVTKLHDAKAAQGELNKEVNAYRDAFKEVGGIAKDSLKEFIHDVQKGDSLSKSLRNTWKSTQAKIFDKAIDNLADSLFGGSGKDSGSGLIGDLFKDSGSSGLLGGPFKGFGLFGGGGASAPGTFSSPLFAGAPFQFSFPGFPDGGMVGMPARYMFSAPLSVFAGAPHFTAGGGVPAFLHPGEIVLNAAQQKNVAGNMAPSITIHNNAPVDVTPRVMSDGQILLHIESRLKQFQRGLPEALVNERNRRN